jgi:hypothetical protein
MKEMSSTSPRTAGNVTFDINVEGDVPRKNAKYSDSNAIFHSLGQGRQFLPPRAAQTERGKTGKKKYIFHNQGLTSHVCPWHAPCTFMGHRFTANEVPNNSEEGLH